jgi:hypothetical protein
MPLPIGGTISKAGVPTSGVAQQITATVVGTITVSGNATFTLTAAGMAGSPIAVSVAVLEDDTATIVAGKARTALAASAVIAAFFTVGGTGADILLTRVRSAANDATMNLAFADDTSDGLTDDATSTATTAGTKGDFVGLESGQFVLDSTNTNFYQNTGTALVPTWTLYPNV